MVKLNYINLTTLLFLILVLSNCKSGKTETTEYEIVIPDNCDSINLSLFGEGIQRNPISEPLTELSGLAASINNPNYYWAHNDSNNPPYLFLLDSLGNLISSIIIKTENIDWEDISCVISPYDGLPYIFIADIGDNSAKREQVRIIKLLEPKIDLENINSINEIDSFQEYFLSYPDGSKDAESLIVDPINLDFYIISKREANSRIFIADYPQKEHNILSHIGTLPFGFATAADISSDGEEILVKNLISIYYWKRQSNEHLKHTFSRQPLCLPYLPEPQGEAICFAHNNAGYFTVSEIKGFEFYNVTFNFFPRLR